MEVAEIHVFQKEPYHQVFFFSRRAQQPFFGAQSVPDDTVFDFLLEPLDQRTLPKEVSSSLYGLVAVVTFGRWRTSRIEYVQLVIRVYRPVHVSKHKISGH